MTLMAGQPRWLQTLLKQHYGDSLLRRWGNLQCYFFSIKAFCQWLSDLFLNASAIAEPYLILEWV
jgi:hypothetical protein